MLKISHVSLKLWILRAAPLMDPPWNTHRPYLPPQVTHSDKKAKAWYSQKGLAKDKYLNAQYKSIKFKPVL